jgi:hypothetical protein
MVFSWFEASHFVLFWRGASSESQRSSRRPIRERELPVRARGQQAMQQVPGVSARFWREEGGGGFCGGGVRGGASGGGRNGGGRIGPDRTGPPHGSQLSQHGLESAGPEHDPSTASSRRDLILCIESIRTIHVRGGRPGQV